MAEVTVYTTSTCPWCVKLKSFLTEEGISFHEVNVAQDPEAARQMVELTGQRSVPVTTIGEQIIIGYNPNGIRELLG
ncbi:MAG TPA: NrdH-redoxin [Firmicutes bacterium]|jgi:glutaredoxin-like YruB-family protein|nr:NrdH-redoxin [Bacillota bacterium]